jgi:hypothetical protein
MITSDDAWLHEKFIEEEIRVKKSRWIVPKEEENFIDPISIIIDCKINPENKCKCKKHCFADKFIIKLLEYKPSVSSHYTELEFSHLILLEIFKYYIPKDLIYIIAQYQPCQQYEYHYSMKIKTTIFDSVFIPIQDPDYYYNPRFLPKKIIYRNKFNYV